ncbi:MAG: hypothetical protein HKM98_11145 [Gammaproteobacteria bacterium]|nr:hypothetical protein [Gammaproteobacteria bacterium]
MKRALLIFEVLGAALFAVAFLFTFQSQEWLLEKSKDVIQKEIRPKADFAVELADEGLRSKLAASYLTDAQIRDSLAEIELYRADPKKYIQSVTGFGFTLDVDSGEGNTSVAGLAAKFLNWKARIRGYFSQTFESLISDLRLFLFSTAVAFGIAAFLISRAEKPAKKYLVASAILALATVFSALAYVDQNWFFTVLLNSYMGWGYPAGIALMFGWLMYDYYAGKQA